MKRISHKFNLLLILSVSISVFLSSLVTTTYLLYKSEQEMHEKAVIQIKGLSDNIRGFLEHAATLNYHLSLNSSIVDSIVTADSDWDTRVSLYNRHYNTDGGFGEKSGLPILVQTQAEYDFVDLLYIQDEKGDQTAKSFGRIGHRAERWWYREFLRGGYKPFISKSYYSLTGNKPVSSVFHPIFNNDEFIGIMGTDINFSRLQEIVEGYLHTQNLYAIVLDMEGVIIAHPDRGKMSEIYNLVNRTKRVLVSEDDDNVTLNQEGYHKTETVDLAWPREISGITSLAIKGERGFIKNINIEGIRSTVYYEPILLSYSETNNGNYAVLLVHDSSSLTRTQIIILLYTLLFIFLFIIIIYLLFRSRFQKNILQPLEALIESMSNVDLDNYTEIKLQTNDEFVLLADTYNELRCKLSIANRKLQEKIEVLKESEAGYKAFAEVGLALSTEKDIYKLLELILDEARRLSRSDGGTLYIYDEKNKVLRFEILHNESLNIRQGGTSGNDIHLPDVPLYIDGKPNNSNVSSCAANTGEIINIPDVYEAQGFDFRGMREYDKRTGYHSQSMLVIPMKNKEDELIGVIQLINAQKKDTKEIIPFTEVYENLIISLASQAAVALTNVQLNKDLQNLFDSFIKSIATAIDEKSSYTGGHIIRVVHLAMLIAEKINRTEEGAFKDIYFSQDELEELRIAAWMHDIGKITTPESLINKETKLHVISDGIELVETRFQLIEQLMEKDYYSKKQREPENQIPDAELTAEKKYLAKEIEFIRMCNKSGDYLSDEKIERLEKIAARSYTYEGRTCHYLTDNEIKHLLVRTGNLNDEERQIIQNHVIVTKKILEQLTFPKKLSRVPEYAAMHHEKLDGSGYPNGLSGDEIPLQARIIAIADIFEALTAVDRPYRKPLKISKAMELLGFMKRENLIDPDILDLLIHGGIGSLYLESEKVSY